MTPIALTIAGSDSGGGAGIQADLKTFTANRVFGLTAITCLTAQNPDSVTRVMPVEADFLREQLLQVDRFFRISAVKTGMLFSPDLIREVARFLAERPQIPAVIDPVMVATSGAVLLEAEAVRILQEELLPLAAVVTPNLDEAGVLLGRKPNRAEMDDAARALAGQIGKPVLLKGGHLAETLLVDILAEPGGNLHRFEDARIENVDTHGSGCTLSAAIAAELAKGAALVEAVANARAYLRHALGQPLEVGGRSFINHAFRPPA
jgi:hydroxymethylpyrimidine/phosphomethylpyrimidine kinase